MIDVGVKVILQRVVLRRMSTFLPSYHRHLSPYFVIEIGEGAVIGAGTVMVKDAEPWGVYAGNPAKYIKKRILKNE